MILSILLVILKIIGIILLAAIVLVLLIASLVLFYPVFYILQLEMCNKNIHFNARTHMMAWMIAASMSGNNDDGIDIGIRIFGIKYSTWEKLFSKIRSLKVAKSKKKKQKIEGNTPDFCEQNENNYIDNAKKIVPDVMNDITEIESYGIEEDTQHDEGKSRVVLFFENIVKRIISVICTVKYLFEKIIAFFKSLVHGIDTFVTKARKIYDFIDNRDNKKGLKVLFSNFKSILKEILPKKLRGNISFGTDDPYLTGQILAFLGITYGIYGEHINISPEFDNGNFIKGNLLIKGRIQIFTLLKICIKLYKNDEFQKLYSNYKKIN